MELTIEQALQQGVTAHREGKLEEAECLYRAILQSQPRHPDANHNLGVLAVAVNKDEAALPLFKTALEANPKVEQFWLSYIDALIKKKEFDNAKDVLEQARKQGLAEEKLNTLEAQLSSETQIQNINSANPPQEQLSSLLEYYQTGRYGDAEKLAISITQEFPEHQFAWKVLGAVLKQTRRITDSLTPMQKSVQLAPQDAEAHNNLGVTLKELGKLDEAEASYRQAILLKSDYAKAHCNLGNTLQSLGRLDQALVSYNQAIELKIDFSEAYSNKNLCLNYFPSGSSLFIFEQHLEFKKQFSRLQTEPFFSPWSNLQAEKRLRIGYVSGDFRKHSVAYFFEPLLQHHNSNVVETFCYYNNVPIDEMTERLMATSDHWRPIVGITDSEVANLIRNDKIDILVDLSGHSSKNRLLVFAQKPAPIQVTWLGYPNTTGLSEIDYRFTDIIADPIGEADELHSEALVRLPNGFQCYKGNEAFYSNSELPFMRRGHITFGSFNNLAKVTPEVIKIWSNILHKIPTSHLLLKGSQINHLKSHYLELFKQEGITENRIEYHIRLPNIDDHLALYNTIDIGLDPFPFNGATTTCEALWMGVPVITLMGDRHVGRVGASILTNVGLTDFIAQDIDGYIQLAVEMAANTNYLKKIRKDLRKRMKRAPLCDGRSFASDVESAYQKMWDY